MAWWVGEAAVRLLGIQKDAGFIKSAACKAVGNTLLELGSLSLVYAALINLVSESF